MKITQVLTLLALVAVVPAGAAFAQTTPTGAATGTSTPTGAVAPDSTPASGRNANRANRSRNRANRNTPNTGRSQDGQYRQSSAANGTSVNSSNTTNYNSNNATNAPTGVGSNPNTANPTSSTNNSSNNNPDIGQSRSGSSGATMSGGSSTSAGSTPTPKAGAPTGTGMAVKAARTTEEPAVAAGSTDRSTSIHDFVASSPNFVTLQNALQSTDLSETLKGVDPYTVFAPSNSAFKKLPNTVQNTLLEGRNRAALTKLLSYHVVKGAVDTAELKRRIQTGGGKAKLETLTGGTLTAQMGQGGQITLTDEQGGTARVDAADTNQSNGVVHSIDAVLSPKGGTAAFQ